MKTPRPYPLMAAIQSQSIEELVQLSSIQEDQCDSLNSVFFLSMQKTKTQALADMNKSTIYQTQANI